MPDRPPLPDWIRLVHRKPWFPRDRYTNAFEVIPDERRLYGTETMYGDWGGTVLLLLQDWSTSGELVERRDDPKHRFHADPWCHHPGIKTNLYLREGFGPEGTPGAVYGSALAGLLKNTPKRRGAPPPLPPEGHKFLRRILVEWVFPGMPRLRTIVCFGGVAAKLVESVCSSEVPLIRIKGTKMSLGAALPDGRPARVFWEHHPAASGWSYERIRAFGAIVRGEAPEGPGPLPGEPILFGSPGR